MSNRAVRCLINCAFPCVSHASGRIGQPYDTWTLCYLKIPLMVRDRQMVDSLRLRRLCATSCNFYSSFSCGPRMLANHPQLCSRLPTVCLTRVQLRFSVHSMGHGVINKRSRAKLKKENIFHT
ncbi:hypothetical protein Naga_100022g57 [Nannochloropsis gaditana]|uniref:Uncharacterized protein n=1 Tax=Nannochloropsis gaditana TaxID=72520 RepID=W7UAE1_9STRA|nr:hypothetical protein Naga_100022g57 [Nannochloropsis gaditana]